MFTIISIVIIVIIVTFIIQKKITYKIDKTYPAIVLDVENKTVLESTTMYIKGKRSSTFLNKGGSFIFKGKVIIDSFSLTLDPDRPMINLLFERLDNFNLWASISYHKLDSSTNQMELYGLGAININDKKMDEIVISLYSEEGAISPPMKKYLVAPANNLQEALDIYNKVMDK